MENQKEAQGAQEVKKSKLEILTEKYGLVYNERNGFVKDAAMLNQKALVHQGRLEEIAIQIKEEQALTAEIK